MNKKLQIFTYIFLFFIFFPAPVAYCPEILDPFYFPRFLIYSIFLCITSILLLISKKSSFRNSCKGIYSHPIFLSWASFLFITALSRINTVNIAEYIANLATVVLLGLLLSFFSIIIRKLSITFNTVSKFALISSLLFSLLGICQFYGIGFSWLPGTLQPYATMGHKNIFSVWLFLLLPFTIFVLQDKNYIWKLLALAGISSNVFVIISIQSRATWLGMAVFSIVMLLFVSFLYFKSRKDNSKYINLLRNSVFAILTVIIVVMITFSTGLRQGNIENDDGYINLADRGKSIAKFSEDVSSNQRLTAWKQSLKMALDYPLIGVGAGNWKIMLPKYGLGMYDANVQSGYYVYLQPHNDFLSVLCETGIFGLISYLGFFFVLLVYLFKRIKRKNNVDEVFRNILLFSLISGYLVVSFFGFPKDRLELSAMIMFIASLVLSSFSGNVINTSELDSFQKRNKTFILFLILSIGLSLCAIYYSYFKINSEMHAKKAIALNRPSQNWTEVIIEMDMACNSVFATLDPMGTPISYYRGEAFYCLKNYEIPQLKYFLKNTDLAEKIIDIAINEYLTALEAHPWHIHTLNDLGTCYEIKGEHQIAINYYLQVLKISPNFEYTLVNLTAVYYNTGNYLKALETISKCDTNSTNYRVIEYKRIILKKIEETKP